MALIDKASLLMVPSTYEAGTLYNVLPSGNRAPDSTDQNSGYDQTRADFTFDRGSNAAATRVNADGLIEKYRENLFLRSNEFNLTWNTYNATISSGATDPNGGSTAWTLAKTGTYGDIGQVLSGVTGVLTFSVYAKAGTLDHLQLSNSAAPYVGVMFDLTDGSVASEANNISSNITSIGDGWYRCEAVVNQSAGGEWRLQPADGVGGVPNANLGNVIIYQAQLETGLVATDYLDSGATTAKAGVLIDLPRINYDANGENGALLLEPSRTNLVAFSEYFNGGIWIQSGGFVTDNDSTSPEGLTNAAKLEGGGGNTQIRLYDNYTFPSTGEYTLSVFAKAGNNDFLRLNFGGVTGAKAAFFDLANGTTEESYASIEPVGSDGWYRCSLTADLTGPDLTGNYNFYVAYSYTEVPFPSNGDANGQYVYLYGAQVEAGSYPTSYIPNHGESGGVTRAADSCSVTGVSDVVPNEGVFYIDMSISGFEDYTSFFELTEGSNTSIRFWAATYSGSTGLFGQIYVQGVDVKRQLLTTTKNERIKAAIRYDSGDIAFYVNGAEVYSGTETFTPEALTSINNFKLFGNSEVKNGGNVYGLGVFPVLTDAELATLTTL